jgi:heat shock protein HslJ
MRVLLRNGQTVFRQITINVAQPAPPPPPPPAADPLAGTRWNVVNFNTGMGYVTSVIDGTSITLAFDASGGVSGNAGCNTYGADYRVNGSSLNVDQPNSTMMFCETPEGVMQQEQQYLAALASSATFSLSGDQLHIRSGSDALALVATRAR